MEKKIMTSEEKKAIAALKKVAKIWPKSLWLFSGSGDLCVMKYKDGDERAITVHGGMDQDYVVDTILGIPNDGGDW